MRNVRSHEDIPLHCSVLGSAKGTYVIYVESVQAALYREHLLLQLLLRRTTNHKSSNRRLLIVTMERGLTEAAEREWIADRIRGWIENTEDDGFLDLARSSYTIH